MAGWAGVAEKKNATQRKKRSGGRTECHSAKVTVRRTFNHSMRSKFAPARRPSKDGRGKGCVRIAQARAFSPRAFSPRARCARWQWASNVAVDDYITFKISRSEGHVLCCRVRGVAYYATFAKMLHEQGTHLVLPGMARDHVEGVEIYYGMCNRAQVSYRELEKSCGVVAIVLEALGQTTQSSPEARAPSAAD